MKVRVILNNKDVVTKLLESFGKSMELQYAATGFIEGRKENNPVS